MLYWAEGARARNAVRFTNSDPAMIKVFADFLRESFGVPSESILVTVNLHADHVERQREIERMWLGIAGVPETSLRRSTLNVVSRASRGRRVGLLPNGTCRLTVNSTEVVQAIFGAIQELGGFDRPEWLG